MQRDLLPHGALLTRDRSPVRRLRDIAPAKFKGTTGPRYIAAVKLLAPPRPRERSLCGGFTVAVCWCGQIARPSAGGATEMKEAAN
jgi:hypothetical protein